MTDLVPVSESCAALLSNRSNNQTLYLYIYVLFSNKVICKLFPE